MATTAAAATTAAGAGAGAAAGAQIKSIFTGQVTPRDLTQYTLFRGVTDFSQLHQFNQFEGGYSFLHVIKIPKFLDELCSKSKEYETLIHSYRHYLEYAFKGLSGFEDITADTGEINNGVSTMNLINKVNMQSASQFSMNYNEQHGLLLAKVHELFLRGIKDPKTGVKTYNGLITGPEGNTAMEAGYENEVFTFLYYVCDNTCRNIEKAYLIVAAQPTTAALGDVSNSERGQFDWKEVSVQFNGIPLVGPAITAKAQQFLNFINENTIFDEMKFGYQALKDMPNPDATGTKVASSSKVEF